MRRRWHLISLVLLGTLGAQPALSENLRPGIIGPDDRVPIEEGDTQYDAVGQVNIGGYRTQGKCTGTLIAPDLVLTAAHCLMDRVKKTPFPLDSIHFLAGVRRGQNKGHSTAKCLRFLDGYEFTGPAPGSSRSALKLPRSALVKDVAVIVLKDKLKLDAAPPLLGNKAAASLGASLIHVSYPADRRFALSAQEGCFRLPLRPGEAFWATSCDTHPASSGGPILMREGGALKIVAVMVAASGSQANLALPISQWRTLAETTGCP